MNGTGTKTVCLIAAALLVAAGAGCEDRTTDTTTPPPQDTTRPTTPNTTDTTRPTTPAPGVSADQRISDDIRAAIRADAMLSSSAQNIQITTSGGVVTLRGTVGSDAERDSIETKAKAVPGVSSVDNQLEVNP